jgi:hypothetical protein
MIPVFKRVAWILILLFTISFYSISICSWRESIQFMQRQRRGMESDFVTTRANTYCILLQINFRRNTIFLPPVLDAESCYILIQNNGISSCRMGLFQLVVAKFTPHSVQT